MLTRSVYVVRSLSSCGLGGLSCLTVLVCGWFLIEYKGVVYILSRCVQFTPCMRGVRLTI